MAKRQFQYDGLDELIGKLDKLSEAYPVLKASLYDGAGILANEIKQKAPDILKKSISVSRMDTGNGKVNTAIVFAGYSDHKTKQYPNGVPYAVIAAAFESGTSERHTSKGYSRGVFKKRPFIQPAIKTCQERAREAMQKQLDEQINDIMEGRQ